MASVIVFTFMKYYMLQIIRPKPMPDSNPATPVFRRTNTVRRCLPTRCASNSHRQATTTRRCAALRARFAIHDPERQRSQVFQQVGAQQHRGGLQRGLQARLQRQDLRRDLLGRRALDALQQVLQRGVGLVVAILGVVERDLGAGELARDVGDLLLVRRARSARPSRCFSAVYCASPLGSVPEN